jgi:hypothetical protein
MRVYLDSAPIIYLVEDVAPYASHLEARLASLDTIQVGSELSRMECRVKPIRLFLTNDHRLDRCAEIAVETAAP